MFTYMLKLFSTISPRFYNMLPLKCMTL